MSPFSLATIFFALLALIGCGYLFVRKPEALKDAPPVKLGIVTVSALAAWKIAAFLSLFVFPTGALAAAQFELLEGAKKVEACGECHVMKPMVTDMRDPLSDSLAARHFKNHFISEDQCYQCHSGYGFNGAIAAKLEGYRHLVRYTTGLYEEPIKIRGAFDSASCLNCHEGTPPFLAINSHLVAHDKLQNNEMSCTNCHGPAHPTRSERTPGSPLYSKLMGSSQGEGR